jgi:uncharacterized protein (DUF1800 family)
MYFDPMLTRYEPTAADPFDAVKAAHLLNRAGFGGTEAEITKVMQLGPQKAVDWLMDFPDQTAETQTPNDTPDLSSIDGYPKDYRSIQLMLVGKTADEKKAIRERLMAANHEALVATAAWWMRRMAYGPHPLQEKLTLLWHGHFTSSAKDERSSLFMWNQNELLRQDAAGNFRDMVRAVSRDPAMLDYLNNQENKREHPNENYARELMELFTLGIGNYTETDVKQAARAFTGWEHDGTEFVFRRYEHDNGYKRFLGYQGNFNGDDIIDIILHQQACPRYIGGKLRTWFISEQDNPQMDVAIGDMLLQSDWSLRPAIQRILTSKAFYAPQTIGAQIKSPVQLVIGTIRTLNLAMPPEGALTGVLQQMGQVPFMPPNVKGWPGGRSWINTSTLFVRYNTGAWLTGGSVPAMDGKLKPFGRLKAGNTAVAFNPQPSSGSADDVVDQWLATMIGRPVDPKQRGPLLAALGENPDDPHAVRRLVQLIAAMPEYQLC